MIYILFAVFTKPSLYSGPFVIEKEFKTKIECEVTLENMKKRLMRFDEGFCQEIRK